ncbi:hypothetical protein BGZ82_002647 [Podila clonocystis]|nr:hypothetical protein BGZ82_002647 [Podila clonocystis]
MKFLTVVALAAVAAVASAQTTCWNQLKACKTDVIDREIDLAQCDDEKNTCEYEKNTCENEKDTCENAKNTCENEKKTCENEKKTNTEQARCWQCAYTEVQRCVDASGQNSWPGCYKNGLRMRKFCLEGQPCGYERPGEFRHLRFQINE